MSDFDDLYHDSDDEEDLELASYDEEDFQQASGGFDYYDTDFDPLRPSPEFVTLEVNNQFYRVQQTSSIENSLNRFEPEVESKIMRAIQDNSIEDLTRELNPEMYMKKNDSGYNVLQLAILSNRKEIFDFLLNLPNFPINEFHNDQHQTTLALVLKDSNDWFIEHNPDNREYFACELIKKGADLNLWLNYQKPIHFALRYSFFDLLNLIIDKRVDINTTNCLNETPLQLALYVERARIIDVVTALLVADAKVTVDIFIESVELKLPFEVQQILYMCLFEENPVLEVSINDLIYLLLISKDFWDILDSSIEIVWGKIDLYVLFARLCSLDFECLEKIIAKCGPEISEILLTAPVREYFDEAHFTNFFSLEKVEFLLQTDLKESVLHFISYMKMSGIFPWFRNTTSNWDEIYSYFLSYGMWLTYSDVSTMYEKYGYDRLLKNFMHMDVEFDDYFIPSKLVVPSLLYNPKMSVDYLLENWFDFHDVADSQMMLMRKYFADHRLNQQTEEEVEAPQIPRLLELARNSFRKYVIGHGINTCKKLVNLLGVLGVSPGDQKIILYETEIYY